MNTANTKTEKVLVLNGSPRKNGSCARMIDAMFSGTDYDICRFDAYSMGAKPCVACGKCEKERACAFSDLDDFFAAYDSVSLVVIASPIYFGGFPAPLKAVFDRVQRFYSERFMLGLRPMASLRKRAVLLLSGGSSCNNSCDYLTEEVRQMFTVLNTELCGRYCLTDTDGGAEFDRNEILKLKKLLFCGQA